MPTPIAATLAVCAALVTPSVAGAHTSIESRSPASGATVSRSLDSVRVTFKARIGDGTLSVTRPGGRKVSRGDGRLVRPRTLRARLGSGLGAGRYTATVRWLSGDGHVQSSTWSFRLR